MLRSLIEHSLRHPGIVAAVAAAMLVFGVVSARSMRLDVFPDFVPPQVVVQTEAPGLDPEQVEALVTRPLEAALGGLGSMETLRSESIEGLSVLTVVFAEGTEVLAARQLLAERLVDASARLPQGVGPPRLSPLTSATMDVLKIGLLSDRLSPLDLRSYADWTVRPRLLMVPGVARVNVFGGGVRQLQVQIDPARLRAHDLALPEVTSAARDATAIRGAGYVETPNQRITLASRGEALAPRALGQAVIASRDGAPVRLADVATVAEAAAPKFGDALVQGQPAVVLTLSAQYGANTLDVTRGLEAALEELRPALEENGIRLFPRLHRPANFIEASLANIRLSLIVGAALVVSVLLLFLRDLRTALISLAAIPLSLLAAVIVLERLGITLNTMSLGGLAIALGEVVDDAIIDVENIARRLRENYAQAAPRSVFRVVFDASLEIRGAVVYATLAVTLVFLPLLTLSGLQGKFFAPLAMSYLLAVGSSLAVALTVTPALGLLVLGRSVAGRREPALQVWIRDRYRRALRRVNAHRAAAFWLAGAACVGAAGILPLLGGELLPEFREGHLVAKVSAAPGISLPEMARIGRRIADTLLALPYIESVEQQIGRAEQGEDTWGPNTSELHLELRPGAPGGEEAMEGVRALLASIPGIQSEVLTFLGDRIGESIAGETSAVVVNLFGEDLDLLDEKARDVATALARVPGAADVQVASMQGSPRVSIELVRDQLARLGLRATDVLDQIQTAYEGTVVAQVHEAQRTSDVAVVLAEKARRSPLAIASLDVRGRDGALLPLRTLAQIRAGTGRSSVLHENGRRRQTVTCNVTGRDLASFVADVEQSLQRDVALPAGMLLRIGGAEEARERASRDILLRSALGGLGIVLLLSLVAGNWRNTALLTASGGLALVGGVLAVAATTALGAGRGVSLGSLVGFVTLFGITVRNAIMIVSHYRRLVEEEGAPWGLETAIRGAAERVVPILMTALVTALALLPIAVSGERAGGEIEAPMAVVILGGLVSSTLLNLLLMPLLCLRFGSFTATNDEDGRA